MQREVLEESLNSLREMGIHTAVETNGTSYSLPELFPLIDQLIMDFKTADPEKHQKLLGPGGDILIENIRSALEKHRCLLVRIPLIQGFNTSDEDMEGFLTVIGEGSKPNASFEFLLYHEFGREKWRQCGLEYRQQDGQVSKETLRLFAETFRNYHLQVVQT